MHVHSWRARSMVGARAWARVALSCVDIGVEAAVLLEVARLDGSRTRLEDLGVESHTHEACQELRVHALGCHEVRVWLLRRGGQRAMCS